MTKIPFIKKRCGHPLCPNDYFNDVAFSDFRLSGLYDRSKCFNRRFSFVYSSYIFVSNEMIGN